MIDFIKVKLANRDRILKTLLDNKHEHKILGKYDHSNKKGIEFPQRSKRENLFINVTEKGAYLENSLHKYFNHTVGNGNQNYNDFNYCDLIFALDFLQDELNYPLEETIINNLEFGFNIELDINPTKFIQNNVLLYDFKAPCYNPKNDLTKKIKKFTYTEFEVKIYDKSLHYFKETKGRNILRIEVKYKSKKQLNKLGIYNLSHLKNPIHLNDLFADFLIKYDKLLVLDYYNGNSLMSKKERQFTTLGSHPHYWIELRENFSRNTITNRKNELKQLIECYELDTWKKDLKTALKDKFNELMIFDCIQNLSSMAIAA